MYIPCGAALDVLDRVVKHSVVAIIFRMLHDQPELQQSQKLFTWEGPPVGEKVIPVNTKIIHSVLTKFFSFLRLTILQGFQHPGIPCGLRNVYFGLVRSGGVAARPNIYT